MFKITIEHRSPTDAIELVHKMKADGWQQGVDFDFAYHQAKYDNDGFEAVSPRKIEFLFYSEILATMFSLKWL